jgi:hypothetical protein
MSNVLTFPGRPPAVEPTPAPAQEEVVAEMVQQSAVMQLVSTLAFYANQGYDGGEKARAAMPALRSILAGRGIALVVNLNPQQS